MRKIYTIVLVIFTTGFFLPLAAQISEGGTPPSFSQNEKGELKTVPFEIMPAVNIEALKKEDVYNDQIKDQPWRFGENLIVSLSPKNSGVWDQLENGDKLWRIGITSKGAQTINLTFDNYRLPKGATLFIYNIDKSEVIGAFTEFNNQEDRYFATTLIKGESIIIEYVEPANVDFPGELNLWRVTHGYRGIADYQKSFGESGACNVNAACSPQGDPIRDQIRSVAMLVTGGSGFCTGALINNTNNDGTPYFLSANHCYTTPGTVVFLFNWQSATCSNPASSPAYNSISGATQKATNSASDFWLMQLNSTPPAEYNVYYAGWNHTTDASIPTKVWGIHHPSADIKKISWVDDGVTTSSYLGATGSGTNHWRVGSWSDGTTTEPGSSGSPLFDTEGRIIGQLHGGYAACGNTLADYYGKLSSSWTGGGTNSTRLSNWLDPANSGVIAIDGYEPNLIITDSLIIDSLALVALYNSTNGPGWTNKTNWLTGPLNTWYGVTVENGRVNQINIPNNNLVGFIPPEIGNLSNLRNLSFDYNQITGSIPAEIGNLVKLEYFDVMYNRLTGSLPPEIGNLSNLKGLLLESNQLSGNIPPEIGNMNSIEDISLGLNQLTGTLPSEICNLLTLKSLWLSDNRMTGSIPPEIGNLVNLESISLIGNQFSGDIPLGIGNLTNLRQLFLTFNQLSGAVPIEIANLSELQFLYIDNNRLEDLPSLTALTNLGTLTIESNKFDFEDIEPNLSVASDIFNYSPQDSVGETQNITINTGNNTTLSVRVGGQHNVYRWLKDGVPISDAQQDTLIIINAETTDAGVYTCQITNTIATELTLNSRPITLNIAPISLRVNSPNGGENWHIGSTQNITWISSSTNVSVHIEYSVNNGIDWTDVIVTTADDGLYTWDIPNNPSTNCVVRVSDIDSYPYDISNGTFTISHFPIAVADSMALVALYNSTNGPGWTNNSNWLTGSVNTWFGVSVENGRVVQINIGENNLVGTIPPEIGDMTYLNVLNIGYNSQLTGNIPKEIGMLTNLGILFLASNQLTGSIPAEIANCGVSSMFLHGNQLSGSFPTALCFMPNLRYLEMSSNQITGSLPKEIGNMTDLGILNLSSNQLTGNIPVEIGRMTNLSYLRLNNNLFSGSIPTEIVDLSNLRNVNLGSNQLTDLPDLSSITTLDELSIENNQFTFEDIEPNIGAASTSFIYSPQNMIGEEQHIEVNWGENSILSVNVGGEHNSYQWYKDDGYPLPGELNDTLRINNADMSDQGRYECRITNTVATELTIISRPIFLNVITKPLQIISPSGGEDWQIGTNQNITWVPNDSIETVRIDYSANNGGDWIEITPAIANNGSVYWTIPNITSRNCVVRVSDIDLDPYDISNTFTMRHIPINVADSMALVALYNSTNGSGWYDNTNWLTGRVNTWSGITVENDRVQQLILSDNNLNGTLPPEIGNLTYLNVLAIGQNSQLTGNMPKEIGNLTNLGILYLASNQLSGSLPAEIASCGAFAMHLQENQLSGCLPIELCLMPRLCFLDMSSNQLTGSLPKEIGNMKELGSLNLNFNQLTGNIPVELGNSPKLSYLFLENNQLAGNVPKEIANMKELIGLSLKSNLLTGRIPIEIGGLTKLKDLNLSNNLLVDLPSLALLSSLEQLSIESNHFTFEDIEYNLGIANTSFTYSPQDLIGETQSTTLYLGDDYNYTLSCGGEHNVYQWYKNGSIITGANSKTLSITDADETDAGVYTCQITNTLATELTLYSRNITITINAGAPEIEVSPTSWNYGYILTQTTSSKSFVISNTGTAPLVIPDLILTGGNASEFSVIDGNKCIIPPSGNYTFQVAFAPLTAGSKNTILRIPSNDQDENPIDIPLTGIGILPNTAPVVSIPDQIVSEGNSFAVISLDSYVTDDYTANANITWSYLGNSNLTVNINTSSRTATVSVPDQNWNGSETITFYARDNAVNPLTGNDAVTFTVTPVNDVPTVSNIPDQAIADGGSFDAIHLDNYVSDLETPDNNISWTYSGNSNLSISIVNRIATITLLSSMWIGSETITFTATDNDLSNPKSASAEVTFTVTNTNLAPVVSSIPDQSVDEGAAFATINLDNYVSDSQTPDASISWSYSGNSQLTLSITNRIATISVPDANWNGSEIITFTAADNDVITPLSGSDAAIFTVNPVNDAPVISGQGMITCTEDQSLAISPSMLTVTDIDNTPGELSVNILGGSNYTVMGSNSLIPAANFNGILSVNLVVSDLEDDSEPFIAIVTVTPANDQPTISDIPDQSILTGESFVTISLDYYVNDIETDDESIIWSYSGNSQLLVEITGRMAIITVPSESWFGSDTITFTATDNDLSNPLSNGDNAIFTVTNRNTAPVVSEIPDQTINFSGTFESITLDNYVEDLETADEDIIWSSTNSSVLGVSIIDRIAYITPLNGNWFGTETIIFTATDDDLNPLSDNTDVIYTINAPNALEGNIQGINIIVYPNPTKGILFIDFSDKVYTKVEIRTINALGQVVNKSIYKTIEDIVEMDMKNLPYGIYHIEIVADNFRKDFPVIIN